jgi:hypothetical protein
MQCRHDHGPDIAADSLSRTGGCVQAVATYDNSWKYRGYDVSAVVGFPAIGVNCSQGSGPDMLGSPCQAAAATLLMFLILLPYVGFRTLGEAMGIDSMLALLTQGPMSTSSSLARPDPALAGTALI